MRPIKFRGKCAHSDEWVYGSLVQESCGDVWIFPEGDTYCNAGGDFYSNKYPGICIVKPETVGQFTGLTDKNGKEIYEGDVLKSRSIIHVVEYKEDEGAFVGRFNFHVRNPLVTMQQTDFTGLAQWWINKFKKEVVGNIHDNPELLNLNSVTL